MLYKLQRGVCPQSYGMECALRAGLPHHIIQHARFKSQEFETSQHSRKQAGAAAAALLAGGGGSKRSRSDEFEGGGGGGGGGGGAEEEDATMQKVRRVLDLVPCSSHVLQGKEALQVHRKLTELWEALT